MLPMAKKSKDKVRLCHNLPVNFGTFAGINWGFFGSSVG